MSLSLLLVAGSIELFSRSQQLYRTNERVAQLQETARHALALLELDLRLAGYWGSSNRIERIENPVAPSDPLPAEFVAATGAINACGPNWALDLTQYVAASDDRYTLDCAAYNRRPQPDSDVLIVRHASNPVTEPPATPRLRLIANASQGRLVIAPCTGAGAGCTRTAPPLPAFPGAQVHDLIVHAWYVSRDATGRPGVPALRRKRLQGGATGATIQDEEIITGIESLQVQLGTAGAAGEGVTFHAPDAFPAEVAQSIVAIRAWLLVRAETPEPGFVDNQSREFPAGRRWPPPEDAYRRLLVSTTIYLRNRRP